MFLPLEIRRLIWKMVVEVYTLGGLHPGCRAIDLRTGEETRIRWALPYVCRQVKLEFEDVLLEEGWVGITTRSVPLTQAWPLALEDLVQMAPAKVLAGLRSLKVEVMSVTSYRTSAGLYTVDTVQMVQQVVSALRGLLVRFKSLRHSLVGILVPAEGELGGKVRRSALNALMVLASELGWQGAEARIEDIHGKWAMVLHWRSGGRIDATRDVNLCWCRRAQVVKLWSCGAVYAWVRSGRGCKVAPIAGII